MDELNIDVINAEVEALNKEHETLRVKLDIAENRRKDAYAQITGVSADNVLLVSDGRVIFNINDVEGVAKAMNTLKPFKNSWIVGTSKRHDVISLYKYHISNDAEGNSLLKIEWENASGTTYVAEINLADVNNELFNAFFSKRERHVYDTESHYFPRISKRRLRDMRIACIRFDAEEVTWYGGDSTLVDSATSNDLTKDILTYL